MRFRPDGSLDVRFFEHAVDIILHFDLAFAWLVVRVDLRRLGVGMPHPVLRVRSGGVPAAAMRVPNVSRSSWR
jgi:hypothetical protein